MGGTLQADHLTVTGPGAGRKLLDWLMGNRPGANTSTTTTTAEAPANDVVTGKEELPHHFRYRG